MSTKQHDPHKLFIAIKLQLAGSAVSRSLTKSLKASGSIPVLAHTAYEQCSLGKLYCAVNHSDVDGRSGNTPRQN